MNAPAHAQVQPRGVEQHASAPMDTEFGVYVHIPYCRTLCPYCDFVKERTSGPVPRPFIAALCGEIAAFQGPDTVGSVFFGGGTPSLMAPEDLGTVLDTLRRRFHLDAPEITLEANPDDVTPALLRAWRDLGINRISLGVQSFDDRTLRYLGRRHDAAAATRACEAVAAHFENWNLDLIFGAPPLETWPGTLARALELAPPHIAAYGLSYEAGTPFERRQCEAVDEETALALYHALEAALANYEHYEISNFAQPGRASRHNLVYWHNAQYAGFGTGAYAFLGDCRARNHISTDAYLKAPGEKMEALQLTPGEIKVETLIQHFRLRAGIEKAHYKQRFGAEPAADFGPALDRLMALGLLSETPTHLRPTPEGFYLNNEIGLALLP